MFFYGPTKFFGHSFPGFQAVNFAYNSFIDKNNSFCVEFMNGRGP